MMLVSLRRSAALHLRRFLLLYEDIWGSFKEIARQPLNGGRRIVSVSDGRRDINSGGDGRIMHGAFFEAYRSPTGKEVGDGGWGRFMCRFQVT